MNGSFPNSGQYKRWFQTCQQAPFGAFSGRAAFFLDGLLRFLIPWGRQPKPAFWPVKPLCRMATQLCPCGYFGSDSRRCKCTPGQIERYLSKISGPLVDRIDIHIDVPAISFSKLRSKSSQLDSAAMREDVVRARDVQRKRFGNDKPMTNARMSHKQVRQFCELDQACEMLLKQAMTEFGLSARAHDKICKVARTIADLSNSENIRPEHIGEAISYRRLDRKL